jgi:HEAT repeat protein
MLMLVQKQIILKEDRRAQRAVPEFIIPISTTWQTSLNRIVKMNKIRSSNNNWVLVKAAQACVLGTILMCDQVFARSVSDLIGQLQAPGTKGKLEVLESKEMQDCFSAADEESECAWTREDWEQVLAAVIGLASDPHPKVREYVAIYISDSTDARIIEPLGHMLRDPDLRVRRVAARSFLTIGVRDQPNVPASLQKMIIGGLEHLLEDESPSIRSAAASAMVLNGTSQSLHKLKKAYRRETDQGTKAVMADVIQQIEKFGKGK